MARWLDTRRTRFLTMAPVCFCWIWPTKFCVFFLLSFESVKRPRALRVLFDTSSPCMMNPTTLLYRENLVCFFVEKVSVLGFTIYFLVSRPQSAVKKRKSFQFLFLFQVVANVLLCAESVECPSISSALTRSRNAGPFDAKGHTHTKKKKVRLIDVFFFFYIIAEGCARIWSN